MKDNQIQNQIKNNIVNGNKLEYINKNQDKIRIKIMIKIK